MPCRKIKLFACLLSSSLLCLQAAPAFASGLDTPNGVTNLPFNIEGVQILNLTQAGLNVGGATSPTYKLQITSSGTGAGSASMSFNEVNVRQWIVGAGVTSSGNFSIENGSGGVDPFTINPSSYVGIGAPNPASQLTVSGAGQTANNFSTTGSLGGVAEIDDTGNGYGNGGALVFSAGTQAWKFAAIKGYVMNGGGNSQGAILFETRPAANNATLTEAMRVNYNGYVGVGATNPIGNLDIENGANTATLCLNGSCVTTLSGSTNRSSCEGVQIGAGAYNQDSGIYQCPANMVVVGFGAGMQGVNGLWDSGQIYCCAFQ